VIIEKDIRLGDVKVVVGLYEPDANLKIVRFTIGIQKGDELLTPYAIDLSTPNIAVVQSPKRVSKSSTSFSADNSNSEGKAIGTDE